MNHDKHKLYNHEVEPPNNTWSKIGQALDDAGNGQQFPQKLYRAEVTAPANSWNKIADVLDNEAYTGIAEKLQEAAVVPGAHNWEAIAAQLAADPYLDLGKKLYHTTATPPLNTWEAIAAQLPAPASPVVPIAKQSGRVMPFLRYAAAAVLIGLTVFGAFKVFGPQTQNTDDQQLVNINTPANTTAPAISNPAVTDTQINENNTAVSPAQDETVNNPVRNRSANNYRQPETSSSDRIYASSNADYTADRYVAFMTLDGNIVRMSKKMEDMICCVTGAEVTGDCKTQLQKWQEKIADAPIVAPGNFMDIFSLVNTLNEGEL